jgi:restriction system protein
MDLPEFARWIQPILKALSELGGSARPQEVVDLVAKRESVSDDVLNQTLSNGFPRFTNQVHWARFFLAEGGLIDRSRRGVWSLSEEGRNRIHMSVAEVRSLVDAIQRKHASGSANKAAVQPIPVQPVISDQEAAPEDLEENYRDRLLRLLKSLPPPGFERLCQRLLREAGFAEVEVTGRSGDGGIDGHGLLALNPFVTLRVLFQCKRYEGSVGSGAIRDFRGAMQGRADKGIILTTGSFTADARREAVRDGVPPLELVDGPKLIDLFEQLELGLRSKTTYEIDSGFFAQFE